MSVLVEMLLESADEDLLKCEQSESITDCANELRNADATLREASLDMIGGQDSPYLARMRQQHLQLVRRLDIARKQLLLTSRSPTTDRSDVNREEANLRRLKEAHKQLQETEQLGQATAEELEKQNRQLQETRAKVEDTQSLLDHSRKLINKLSQWWRV